MNNAFRIRYQNYKAKGWTDFYPLKLFTDKKSGLIEYRCRYYKKEFIAKGTLNFGEGYADIITGQEEADRLEIYPGTIRFFLKENRDSIEIVKVMWADPGKQFVMLEPPPIIDQIECSNYTHLCAYTIRHSSSLEEFSDGGSYTIDTGGRIWARIATLMAERQPSETVPVLFAPAENVIRVTGCADLTSVKTMKNDGINSFTFENFRYLSPPLLKSSIKWSDGHPLGQFLKEYAICRTPADLAKRRVVQGSRPTDDIAAIDNDPNIPEETTRKALVDARLGQGAFRKDLDERWDNACAVTRCSIRDILRASHIKPWKISTNEERLDPHNGILLSANIDILFEKGFVSFDDRGRMLVSERLSGPDRRLLGLPVNLKRKPDDGERAYLEHHRRAFRFDQ